MQGANLEIELSDLKGLAKITRKAELQRKIDEKTYYINRLKIGLSNMVRNYGFENMNEFYLSYKESKSAYAEYQQKTEDWKKSFGNTDNSMDKAETMSEKLARLQKEADSYRQYNRRMSNKFQDALKQYARRKDKNLRTLMKYASMFHVEKILRPYLEVLL